MDETYLTYWKSPLGAMAITGTESFITSILFKDEEKEESIPSPQHPPLLDRCIEELNEYFNRQRESFDLPFKQKGSAFEMEVWAALEQIPYGATASYQAIAAAAGNVRATRAVGNACHKNKLNIIVPCHRIIGIKGLTGYAGGLFRKQYLLNLENHQPVQPLLF